MAEEKKTTDGAEGRNGSGTTYNSEGGKKNVTGSIRNG